MMARVAALLEAVAVAFLGAAFCCSSAVAGEPYVWRLPRGFPVPAVPADNPMTVEKVALGAKLFGDTRLSVTGRYSCESCHSPSRAFTDGLARSRGAEGDELPLNAPTLINAAYDASYGWRDPTVRSFEAQMRGPLFNEHPRELGLAGRESIVEHSLTDDAKMRRAFAAAFPGDDHPVSVGNVIRAIAAYERTLISAGSPFDRYVFAGEHEALDETQKAGMRLFFGSAKCGSCHGGINFSGEWRDRDHPEAAPGFADTGTGERVRVPTLRNLAATAPYMHDGRFATLTAVLDHYEKAARDPAADPRLRRPPLTTLERAELLAFLGSLNDAR